MGRKKPERDYQAGLIKRIKKQMPECIVLKNDSGYQQGIPDLSVLCENSWAFLEVKRSADEPTQPNQDWFVERAKALSFGAFIHPDNEQEVLDAFQQSRRARG